MGAYWKNIEDFSLILKNCFTKISGTDALSRQSLPNSYAQHVCDFVIGIIATMNMHQPPQLVAMKKILNFIGYTNSDQLDQILQHTDDEAIIVKFKSIPVYFEDIIRYDLSAKDQVVCSRLILVLLLLISQEVLGISTNEMIESGDCNLRKTYALLSEHICLLDDYLDKYGVTDYSFRQNIKSETIVPAGKPEISPQKAAVAKPPAADLDTVLRELDELVGIASVKAEVKTLTNLARVRKMRMNANLPVIPISLHLVFTGNPGTGKTTVARLVSKIYKSLGLLSQGHLVEVDRSGLVAGYVGQTALKVQDVIQNALGGVLFIDEAYALAGKGDTDFGREAIDTLLKAMEDHREDFVIIVAGYQAPMEEFLASNPGMRSRFNRFIHFEDYAADELLMIFKRVSQKNGYFPVPDAYQQAMTDFQHLCNGKNFANARTVRNFFEQTIARQANRIVNLSNPTKDEISTVLTEDLPAEEEC